MRLIDADALMEREKVNPFFAAARRNGKSVLSACMDYLSIAVESAPTIDAVPVVRCKDCIKHIYEDDVDYICGRTGIYTRFDDFCSYGERRDTHGN